ncbi:HAD hydrolase-like protein [Aureimonas leprariae]|uniref:HAD hydrolase-like protein n=1 Tax=Plantimonas leprariae TaxID=2615207 RepID=A0A7V7PTD1_9HYPH|nr:HAD hydrolase-like protein [Aureimonas leprariae]KAB0682955.1 HAD hydrolase-like protein [Aureimonas leprariae]
MDSHAAPRLAIFDFDGTLADSLPWFVGVLDEVAERHGFRKVDEALALRLRTLDTTGVLKELGIPLWKVPAIARDLRARKMAAMPPVPIFAGTREMLEALRRRGIVIGIVSSDSEGSVRRTLGSELAHLVSHYNCSASIFGKASKLRQVASAARIPPSAAVYVGDETRDAEAAAKAAMRFGAVTWGYSTRDVLFAYRPAYLFDRIEDIPAILPSRRAEAAALLQKPALERLQPNPEETA